MRFVSACLLVFLVFLITAILPVFAHEDHSLPEATEGQINEALAKTAPLRFLPSHSLYFVISLKEKINRFFQPSSLERAKFDFVVSGKRLKESYILLSQNDVRRASRALVDYSKRLTKMNEQIEKARSQNQDVAVVTFEIAEGLRNHEVLLYAISKKWELIGDSYNFDENLSLSVLRFIETVKVLDNIKPGIKDRFKTATSAAFERKPTPTPSPASSEFPETSSTARPKRLIY